MGCIQCNISKPDDSMDMKMKDNNMRLRFNGDLSIHSYSTEIGNSNRTGQQTIEVIDNCVEVISNADCNELLQKQQFEMDKYFEKENEVEDKVTSQNDTANIENIDNPKLQLKEGKKKKKKKGVESAGTKLENVTNPETVIGSESVGSLTDGIQLLHTPTSSNLKLKFKKLPKKSVVFLVYPSGTNKDEIVYPTFKEYGFDKISAGSILKENAGKHPVYGEIINNCFRNNLDIKGDIIVNLINERIQASELDRFLVSGFPRTEDNSRSWKKVIGTNISVVALVMITYTRDEYEKELNERAKIEGNRIGIKEAMTKYNFFLKETNQVFDDFGKEKCIKISAKLQDHLFGPRLIKNELIAAIVN